MQEYTTIAEQWPGGDSMICCLRYLMTGAAVAGRSVLEVGCGSGEGAIILAGAVKHYLGMDNKPHWGKKSQPTAGDDRFIEGDACSLSPERNGQYEAVVALELVEHLEDIHTFSNSIKSVLSPDGICVISTPNVNLLSRDSAGCTDPLYCHHRMEFTPERFVSYLEDFGMEFTVLGLSQLAPEGEAMEYSFVFGDTTFILEAGSDFRDIMVKSTIPMRKPIPLNLSQCFFAVLGPGAEKIKAGSMLEDAICQGTIRSKGMDAAKFPARTKRMTCWPFSLKRAVELERVCRRSVEWILLRRNRHVRELIQSTESLVQSLESQKKDAFEKARIIENREDHINSLEQRIKHLTDALKQKDAQIEHLTGEVEKIK